MRDFVNVDDLANWVSMLRSQVRGAIWLPQTDSEARFYERLAHPVAQVMPAAASVRRLAASVSARGVRGVVATVRRVVDRESLPESVFCPAIGDVASLLVLSSSFEDVIRDSCGTNWVRALEGEVGSIKCRAVFVARALDSAISAGFVRADDYEQFWELVDWNSMTVKADGLAAMCGGWLPEGIAETCDETSDPKFLSALQQCDGVIVFEVIAQASMRSRPHGIGAEPVAAIELMGRLRMAFRLPEFESDDIYWQMRGWERRHKSYPLLRNWRDRDPLGVVTDQRYWEQDLAVMLLRRKSGDALSLVKLDLDNFKGVNTAAGHTGGDEAIRSYCKIVEGVFGEHGEVYRRGGDEMLAILPYVSRAVAEPLCERARAEVESHFAIWCATRNVVPAVTASIGVVEVAEGETQSVALGRLDEAQERSKQMGKNRVTYGG